MLTQVVRVILVLVGMFLWGGSLYLSYKEPLGALKVASGLVTALIPLIGYKHVIRLTYPGYPLSFMSHTLAFSP